MSQTDINPIQPETVTSDDAFQTPWQKRFLGKQEQLALSRNPNGIVTVQMISKVVSEDFFKKISDFFSKKSPADQTAPIEKLTVEAEKKFTNISIERFENEKREIQKLLDKHTSIGSLLKHVEKDLKGQNDLCDQIPFLTPDEIEERSQTIKQMRAELDALMKKIDEEEASPELQSYEQLKSSIERIKNASSDAFSKIITLQKQINNPKVSSAQLKELADEIAKLDASNNDWKRDLVTARKIFALDKESLQNEIDLRTGQIQSCSEEIKNQWDQLIAKWKHSPVSEFTSKTQIQQYRLEINTLIEKIGEEYRKEINNKIATAFTALEASLDATTPDFSNKDKLQAHLDFRSQVLASRKKSWFSVNDLWQQSANHLDAIERLQSRIVREEATDRALIESLTVTTDQESYMEKFLSLISPLTSIITPFIPSLPPFLSSTPASQLVDKENFDEAALFYVNQSLKRINWTITQLLESILDEGINDLIEQYEDILSSDSLMESELASFIDELISFAKNTTANPNDEEAGDLDFQSFITSIAELQGQKEVLSILIKSQQQHAETIAKQAQADYPGAFKNARPTILEAAEKAVDLIMADDSDEQDLRALSNDWQTARITTAAQLETIKCLETLENHQKRYEEIAKKREKLIKTLTGEEKIKAELALEAFQEEIASLDQILDEAQANPEMVSSYNTKLVRINNSFEPILEMENRKKELRSHLNREIAGFNIHLNQCDQAITELEKHYSIKLDDAKKLVKNKREAIQKWKEQGVLPSAYLKYLPSSALPTLLYYGSSQLSFEETKVTDLNLSDLAFYIENLKANIVIQKNDLSSHCVLESYMALKTFQDFSKNLEGHVNNLIGGVTVTPTFSGENQYEIPEGLSSTNLAKLQFHNASLTSNRKKNLISQQNKAVSAKPDLKSIHQRLNEDIDALTSILEQSKRGTTLSLIDQIQKFEDNPDQQVFVKEAFIKSMTTKLADHATIMTSQIKGLKGHPKIQEEAVRQINRTEQEFFKQLKTTPKAIQDHAERWKVLTDPTAAQFSTKDDLAFESLSVYELKSYLEIIEKTITQGNDYIRLVKGAYAKIELANKKFQDKVKEADIVLQQLDSKNQVLEMQRLKNIVSHAGKSKNDFVAKSEPPEESLFPSFNFLTPSKNINPTHATLQLLDDIKKNIGNGISLIDAAIKKAKQVRHLTIPEQLALCRDSKTEEDLRKRFQKEIQPLILKTRETLEKYKLNDLPVIYARYVSPSSNLISKIAASIDEKLHELNQFEENHQSYDKITSLILGEYGSATPVSALDSKQMANYHRQLKKLQSTLTDDLNKKYQIKNLIDAQVNYENMLDKIVKAQSDKLRKDGFFTEAFLMERKIEEIKEKEAKWVEKISQAEQLTELVANLKTFTREINSVVSEFNPKKTPNSFEEQIRILLSRKEEFSSFPFNLIGTDQKNQDVINQIDEDISALKTKMTTKIGQGYEKHQSDLRKRRNQIDEIYSTYNIRLQPKESVIAAYDKEIERFDNEVSTFYTPHYQILANDNRLLQLITHSTKHIEDMAPEEIVQVRPEKNHQSQIDSSNKKIAATFNDKLIQEPHSTYQTCLENAENTRSELIQKEQISHAYDLDVKINKIKSIHEEYSKKEITNNDQLSELSKKLLELSSRLTAAKSTASALTDMDISDQIEQLTSIDPNSRFVEHLKNSIVNDIEKIIEDQKKTSNETTINLNKLVSQLGFPHKWREAINTELDSCLEELERKKSSLIEQYATKKTSWFNKNNELALSEYDLKNLVSIQKALKTEEEKIKKIIKQYSLKAIDEQLTSYEKELTAIQSLKLQWTNEYLYDSAEDLDVLMFEAELVFKDYFKQSQGNLQAKMQGLLPLLKNVTNKLFDEKAKIKKTKPQTLGQILLKTEVDSTEYKTLHKAIRKQIQTNIANHKKSLSTYFNKIDSINEAIQKNTPDCPMLSSTWRRAVEEKITKKQLQLEELEKGLPVIGEGKNDWIPYEDLTPAEIVQYETMVNRLAPKDDDKKAKNTSVLGKLEQLIHLKDIEKYFNNYQNATKYMEAAIAKPSISKDKKTILETFLAANNQLFYSSIQNLECLGDSIFFLQTLEQVQAVFYRASQEKGMSINNFDSWSVLRLREEHPDVRIPDNIPNPIESILKTGSSISYSQGGEGQDCTVSSMKQKIDDFKARLEKTQASLEKTTTYLQKQGHDNHPKYQILADFLSNRIPECFKELTKIETEITIKNKSGKITDLNVADIKTFDEVLNYKNQLDKFFGNYLDECETVFEMDFLYWAEQVQQTEAQENDIDIPAMGNEDPDDYFDIDSDSGSANSEISRKSSSTRPEIRIDSNTRKNNDYDVIIEFPEESGKNSDISKCISDDASFEIEFEKKPQEKAFVPFEIPEIQLGTFQANNIDAVEQSLAQIELLTNSLKQMNRSLQMNQFDIGEFYLGALEEFAKHKQDNKAFLEAYQTFRSFWDNASFRDQLTANATQLRKEYTTNANKILSFKENTDYKTNLLNAFDTIIEIPEAPTMNQWAAHLKNLCHASQIKIQLENIAKYTRRIYELCGKAEEVVAGGKSVFISGHIFENWHSQLNEYSKISPSTNLNEIENKLASLSNLCEKNLKEDSILRNKKRLINEQIQNYQMKMNKKINFIQKEFGCNLDTFANSVKRQLGWLKERELSPNGLELLNTKMNQTFDQIINDSGILEGYVAAKKLKILMPEIKEKITEFTNLKQFTTAKKLKSDLNSGLELFPLIRHDFKDFTKKMELILEKLTYGVKNKETIDLISQLEQLTGPDPENYRAITNAIIGGLKETVDDIEEKSKGLNRYHPKMTEKVEEILSNCRNLISLSKNFSLVNKHDFITHVNSSKKKFNEAKDTLHSIRTSLQLLEDIDSKKIDIAGLIKQTEETAQEIIKNLKNANKTKPYFYLAKLNKLKNDLGSTAELFQICMNSGAKDCVIQFIENGKILGKLLNSYKTTLRDIATAEPMNPFAQLKAAEKEPEILSIEQKQSIIDGIKDYGNKKIKKIVNAIKTYSELAQNYPESLTSQMITVIRAALKQLKDLSKEIYDIDDPAELQKWVNTIRRKEAIAVSDLEQVLKLKAHQKDFNTYDVLMKEVNKLLEYFENNYSDFEAPLRKAKRKMESMQEELLQNNNDLDSYWKGLNAQCITLQTVLRDIKAKLKK